MRTSRAKRGAARAGALARATDSTRRGAEQRVRAELDAWRTRVVPDANAPLDADDLVRLLRDCIAALHLDPAIAAGFTVNTVHYYRRKDIVDPPDGRTAAARYDVRHLWQIAGARLAGYLGLVTLAEARSEMRGADSATLLDFLAARVTDARARHSMHASANANAAGPARPLPAAGRPSSLPPVAPESALMIALPGNAWCIVPAAHEANRSREAAGALGRALTTALRGNRTP